MIGKSLVDLLFAQVETRPEHCAIIHGELRLTYGDLWQRIIRQGAWLEEQGVRPGDRVVLLMDNSIHYVVSYYAVIRMAAVIVPLNTGLKGRQLSQLISHAQPRLILHRGKQGELNAIANELADLGSAIFEVGDPGLRPVDTVNNRRLQRQAAAGAQLTAIVYTSGTTGRPKGVMLSANNLLSNTLAIIDYLGLTSSDRVACVLPFYYAYGNSVLHTHLAVGASLVLENSLMYPQRVLQRMAMEEVTGFSGVPSTFRLLLLRCSLEQFPLPRLRYITQAGGAMSPHDIARINRCWPSAQFFAMYGQTEATARLSYLPPERLKDKAASVGLPLSGVRLKIMDENGEEKMPGESGEICASGPNIMLGYWRDPAATEARFFGEWLRSGDLGYQDEEGFTTVLGRSTDIIKTGDHRVAPEEVEQVIALLDSVEEVAVVGAPDRLLGQVIIAYVVLVPGSTLEKRDILRHCKRHCAQYKIPREIEVLSTIPKTASGKIQRYKLLETGSFTENCL